MKELKVKTEATINFEARAIWVNKQEIFLDDQYLCSMSPHTINPFVDFTTAEYKLLDKETIGPLVSRKLYLDLIFDKTIRTLIEIINRRK